MGARHHWILAAAFAWLVSSSALVGVSMPQPSSASVSRGGVARAATAARIDVRVYFLRREHIAVAHRSVPWTKAVASAAMRALLSGPSAGERAIGLTTTIPSRTGLLGVEIEHGTATVDLSRRFASGGGSLSMMARLAQVTFTLTQFSTVQRVRFELDGVAVHVFGGEGILLDHPVTRATYESLSPAILIERPGRAWAVRSPLRVSGTANVFEAQFSLELTDAAGRVLARRRVHASAGTGTRGSFDVRIAFSVRSAQAGTLIAFDNSPKDGSRIDVVEVPLRLRNS